MRYDLSVTGTFFEGSHALSVELAADGGDVVEFQCLVKQAAGFDRDDQRLTVQYEDPDFGEYCDIDGKRTCERTSLVLVWCSVPLRRAHWR